MSRRHVKVPSYLELLFSLSCVVVAVIYFGFSSINKSAEIQKKYDAFVAESSTITGKVTDVKEEAYRIVRGANGKGRIVLADKMSFVNKVEYSVEGKLYKFDFSTSKEKYYVGQSINVYYDKVRPEICMVEVPETNKAYGILFLVAGVLLAGLTVVYAVIQIKKKNRGFTHKNLNKAYAFESEQKKIDSNNYLVRNNSRNRFYGENNYPNNGGSYGNGGYPVNSYPNNGGNYGNGGYPRDNFSNNGESYGNESYPRDNYSNNGGNYGNGGYPRDNYSNNGESYGNESYPRDNYSNNAEGFDKKTTEDNF